MLSILEVDQKRVVSVQTSGCYSRSVSLPSTQSVHILSNLICHFQQVCSYLPALGMLAQSPSFASYKTEKTSHSCTSQGTSRSVSHSLSLSWVPETVLFEYKI